MTKRKQIGFMGAIALALGTMAGGAQNANALQPTSENVRHQESKEGIHVEKRKVRPVSEQNRFGGFSGAQNPFKHIKKGYKNQRQYRKWRRSNPNA